MRDCKAPLPEQFNVMVRRVPYAKLVICMVNEVDMSELRRLMICACNWSLGISKTRHQRCPGHQFQVQNSPWRTYQMLHLMGFLIFHQFGIHCCTMFHMRTHHMYGFTGLVTNPQVCRCLHFGVRATTSIGAGLMSGSIALPTINSG